MISLPIAIVTLSEGAIISIDQVFNCFGYMGNTRFTIKGVKVLAPNGYNDDGSYNNLEYELGFNLYSRYGNGISYFTAGNGVNNYGPYYDQIERPTTNGLWYNPADNYMRLSTDNGQTWNIINQTLIGTVKGDSTGRIQSFYPRYTFQSLDKNDKLWISAQGKPSNKYVDLSLNATGSSYKAPANGWVTFAKRANNANEYNSIHLEDHNCRWDCNATVANMWCSVSLPVKQNEKFIIEYTTSGELQRFRFIYDEGAK